MKRHVVAGMAAVATVLLGQGLAAAEPGSLEPVKFEVKFSGGASLGQCTNWGEDLKAQLRAQGYPNATHNCSGWALPPLAGGWTGTVVGNGVRPDEPAPQPAHEVRRTFTGITALNDCSAWAEATKSDLRNQGYQTAASHCDGTVLPLFGGTITGTVQGN
ncbi:hypothetical protein [Amycolatopsis anabasis]|uniref:hypothetical protein n=1 Tax=Amycolatopsis anabasis TaxID=1840409 RepID=UPI00131D509A|nr:hypothetical protein [Amycolatopsis anabasis]